ncbi:hypothetical protein NVV94_09750 [Pseudomonas sp. LS1212]|nr:hypothetical protein [Pseudomonas sp. LS1212]UVJ45798.1 hypothetical protein NVV94_09750 [Pseudomonas sp. LS1212]
MPMGIYDAQALDNEQYSAQFSFFMGLKALIERPVDRELPKPGINP